MADQRTWNLRFNLDAFNSVFAGLDQPEERADFMSGLSRGANGGRPKDGASAAWEDGFRMGFSMREEAETFRGRKAEEGRKGAQVRYGKAVADPCLTHGSPMADLKLTHAQSTIHNPITTKKEEAIASSCSEPEAPTLLLVPCVGTGQKSWPLTQPKLDEWKSSFPGVDVLAEIRKAVQWLRDNPTRGKTARGMPAFLGRWLGRAQDNNPSTPKGAPNGKPQDHRFANRDAKLAAQLSGSRPLPEVRGEAEPDPWAGLGLSEVLAGGTAEG